MPTYYVSPTGSDSGAGTEAAPFRTITKADQLLPKGGGNEIVVLPGVHTSQAALWAGGVSGKPNRLVGRPGAIIHTGQVYDAVRTFSSYWEITGLELVADSGHGVDTEGQHHVWVHHCHAHDCEGSGFSGYRSDWIAFEDNLAHDNAGRNWNQCSGLSVAAHRELAADGWEGLGIAFDATGLDRFRTAIRRNISHDNVESAEITNAHTDGNGVIVDWMRNVDQGVPAYPGRVLVEGNLVFDNGGKGVQVFMSDNVTVRRNTCVRNNIDPLNDGTWRGDLSISQARGCEVIDNIVVCQRGKGILAYNRAIGDTALNDDTNQTAFSGNLAWDPAGVPSFQNAGGNPGAGAYGKDAITWVDPDLGPDWLPRAAIAAGKGWRGTAAPDEPDTPEETDMDALKAALDALIAAFAAYAAETETRIAAIEARPTDPEIAARVAALEAQSGPELAARVSAAEVELVRLDGRLDAISGAARD